MHDSRCAQLWYCEFLSTVDVQEHGGFETPADSGTLTNFVEIGQARDKILSLKLDQVWTPVTNFSSCLGLTVLQVSGTATTSGSATSIDPKGYLTSLDSQVIKTEAEIGDIKRARMLFDSLIKSNPKHAPGWIAAAALEEHAGRMVAARKLIKQGCDQCPKSEDVWLEAARLHVREFDILSSEDKLTLSPSKSTTPKSFLPMLRSTSDKV
jgi:pre-mRNA-processing factor 6